MVLKRTIKDICILEHCIILSSPSSDLAVGCGTSDRQIVLKKERKNREKYKVHSWQYLII